MPILLLNESDPILFKLRGSWSRYQSAFPALVMVVARGSGGCLGWVFRFVDDLFGDHVSLASAEPHVMGLRALFPI